MSYCEENGAYYNVSDLLLPVVQAELNLKIKKATHATLWSPTHWDTQFISNRYKQILILVILE